MLSSQSVSTQSGKKNRHWWGINTNDLPIQRHDNQLKQVLPKEIGIGYSRFINLDQDLNYIETQYRPAKDLSLMSEIDHEQPKLVLTLGIKGKSRFVAKQGQEIHFTEGYTTITSFNSSIGERQYQANKDLMQLRFILSQECLIKYFGENQLVRFFNKNAVNLISHQPTTTAGLIAAQQLIANNVPDQAQHIFLHGQALSLLASELSHLFNKVKTENTNFSQNDKEKAKTARDILFTEFKTPPSVSDLAKRVGTNQFKLKQLFHHYFNTTPYGLLLEIRMNKAYQILQTSHCHVSVAADLVGYKHASNFSTAFVKYFAISPKHIARR